MRVHLGFLLAVVVCTSACQVDGDKPEAVPGSMSSSIETASTDEIVLPFDNPFPNRRNPSNDGTPFEPCVAFSDEELLRFDVDPAVVEDAALVDGQGIRGCGWYMPNKFALSSLVTNAVSLEEYKKGKPELDWRPDLLVGGRIVGLAGVDEDKTTCATYVKSHGAIVVTDVLIASGLEAGLKYDACRIAVDFTTAYIDKIPD